MKNRTKLLLLVVCLTLICTLTFVSCGDKGNGSGSGGGVTEEDARIFMDADLLPLGTSQDEVVSKLGEPHDIEKTNHYIYYAKDVLDKYNEQDALAEKLLNENLSEEEANRILSKIEEIDKAIAKMPSPELHIYFAQKKVESIFVDGNTAENAPKKEIKKYELNKNSLPIYLNRDEWDISYQTVCTDGSYRRAKIEPNISVRELGDKAFNWSDDFGNYEGKITVTDEIMANYTYKCHINPSVTLSFETKAAGTLENVPNVDLILSGSCNNLDFSSDGYYQDYKTMFNSFKSKVDIVKIDETVSNINGAFLSNFDNCSLIVLSPLNTSLKQVNNSIYTHDGTKLLYSGENSLNIPSSVREIGPYALAGNNSITNINIPSSVQTIGEGAFAGCKNVTSINSSTSNYQVVDNCLVSGTKLIASFDQQTLPVDISTIGAGSFAYTTLETVNIPDSVTTIENNAFKNSSKVKFVKFNEGSQISVVGEIAFNNCLNEVFYDVPQALLETMPIDICFNIKLSEPNINTYYLQYCDNLYKLWIPSTVETLDYNSISRIDDSIIYFEDDEQTAKSKFNLPDTNYVFNANTNLKDKYNNEFIEDNQNLYKISNNQATLMRAPNFITKLSTVSTIEHNGNNYPVVTIGEEACIKNPNLLEINVAEGITDIKNRAFMFCHSLTKVTLPSTLTLVGTEAFGGCDSINEVYAPYLETWVNINFGIAGNPLNGANLYINGSLLREYEVPKSMDTFKYNSFVGCKSLESVKLHKNLTFDSTNAFYNCPNLKTVKVHSLDDYLTINFKYYENNPLSNNASLIFDNGTTHLHELVIPDSITSIPEGQFAGINNVDTFVLGSGVTTIEDDAFRNSDIITFVMKDSVTTIEDEAFLGCNKLQNITFSNKLEYIGDWAFKDCVALDEVVLPDSLVTLYYNAFDYAKFNKITMPNSIVMDSDFQGAMFENLASVGHIVNYKDINTYLSDNYYYLHEKAGDILLNNQPIKNITLPSDMTEIFNNKFKNMRSLESIDLSNVTRIGDSAFMNCIALKHINLPKIEYIDDEAFMGCSSLKQVELSNNLEYIGGGAFQNCTALEKIDLKDTKVTSIGTYAFSNDKLLTELFLPDTVTFCGGYILEYVPNVVIKTTLKGPSGNFEYNWDHNRTKKLDVIWDVNNIVTSQNMVFKLNPLNSTATLTALNTEEVDVVVPKEVTHEGKTYSVTAINDDVFFHNLVVKNISIPSTIKNYNPSMINYCFNLEYLCLENEEQWFSYQFNVPVLQMFSKGLKVGNIPWTTVVVPATCTEISKYMFANCKNIETITLNSSVTSIGDKAFSNCKNLKNVVFKEGLISLGVNAFSNSGITSAVLPNTLTTAGEYAFFNCQGLTALTTGSGLKVIPRSFAENDINLKYLDIKEGNETISNDAFLKCINLTNCKLSNTTKKICNKAFSCNFSLSTLTIPSSVTMIENYAFEHDSQLVVNVQMDYCPDAWGGAWDNTDQYASYDMPRYLTVLWNNKPENKYSYYIDPNGIKYNTRNGKLEFLPQNAQITNLYIPATVTVDGTVYEVKDIPVDTLRNLDKLVSIEVDPENKYYKSEGNCLIRKSDNVLVRGCINSVIPNYVKIGENAFRVTQGLKSIEIPEGVDTIGDYAFSSCYDLEEIILPSTIVNIGYCIAQHSSQCYIYFNTKNEYTKNTKWNGSERLEDGTYTYTPVFYKSNSIKRTTVDNVVYNYFRYGDGTIRVAPCVIRGKETYIMPETVEFEGQNYACNSVYYESMCVNNPTLKELYLSNNLTKYYTKSTICSNVEKIHFKKNLKNIEGSFVGTNVKYIFYDGLKSEWDEVTKDVYLFKNNEGKSQVEVIVCNDEWIIL